MSAGRRRRGNHHSERRCIPVVPNSAPPSDTGTTESNRSYTQNPCRSVDSFWTRVFSSLYQLTLKPRFYPQKNTF